MKKHVVSIIAITTLFPSSFITTAFAQDQQNTISKEILLENNQGKELYYNNDSTHTNVITSVNETGPSTHIGTYSYVVTSENAAYFLRALKDGVSYKTFKDMVIKSYNKEAVDLVNALWSMYEKHQAFCKPKFPTNTGFTVGRISMFPISSGGTWEFIPDVRGPGGGVPIDDIWTNQN
ncbi:hypothetical protein [Bacillus thuringiensis]|uniref:hypothetical protein n=1 Tax=Bacillus thuringiensis TaxID=1428 RepID=UPI003458208B